MADVEEVEGSGNINNLLPGLGPFAVGELEGGSGLNVMSEMYETWRSF